MSTIISNAYDPDNPIVTSPEFHKIFSKDVSQDVNEFPELTLDYVSAISHLWTSAPFQAIWASAFPTSYLQSSSRNEDTDRLVSLVTHEIRDDDASFSR